jgi:hypothetical protein
LRLLGRTNRVKSQRTATGGIAYFTQFHDSRLYEWFRSVGLTPRKSLTLGSLNVPRDFFFDTARGLMDGDGSIMNFRYRGGGKARGREYETILLYFNGASLAHLEWIRAEILAITNIPGRVQFVCFTTAGNPFYRLEYAMGNTKKLLPMIYQNDEAPCLGRKRAIWDSFLVRDAAGETRSRLI